MFNKLNSLLVLCLLCLSPILSAQQAAKVDGNLASVSKPSTQDVLRQLGSEYHNGIELLQNRFRIDYKVDEITMIFFREYGSAPIVLVRPDGSKIFQSQADGETVFWYDTATYDMISLKNPTPGPWQAIGQVLPESRVMVISDLNLHAEPLPKIVFSGEILKQTAYLTNNGKPIDYVEFRDVVTLNIEFQSTNNPQYSNFGARAQTIANFEDNGRGMDEQPLDGIFTGQFNLAVAPGEWLPNFVVSTPMFTRKQVDEPLMLYPNPIKVSVELDGGGDGYHKLIIDANREHVDMTNLLLDGKIRFPGGDVQNFSLTDTKEDIREHLIVNYEYGVYRIKLTAFGSTVDGREFILDVPEFSFLTEEPKLSALPLAEKNSGQGSAELTEFSALQVEHQDEMSTSTLIMLIVGINFIILGVGGVLIWYFGRTKPPKVVEPEVESPESDPKPTEKVESNDQNGIIDLGMPKD